MENLYPYEGWRSFREGSWVNEIDLRSFIRHNFTMYDGNESFLEGPTQNTLDLWEQVMDLTKQEREAGGVLDMDTHVISTITSHGPGYLNKDKERIVGFQTDKPFKRALHVFGGIRMSETALRTGASAFSMCASPAERRRRTARCTSSRMPGRSPIPPGSP